MEKYNITYSTARKVLADISENPGKENNIVPTADSIDTPSEETAGEPETPGSNGHSNGNGSANTDRNTNGTEGHKESGNANKEYSKHIQIYSLRPNDPA